VALKSSFTPAQVLKFLMSSFMPFLKSIAILSSFAFSVGLRWLQSSNPTCCVQCSPTHQTLARLSAFNATYNDDQKSSHADYIHLLKQLSMQAQFNKRALW
jgi:hypothetical protein